MLFKAITVASAIAGASAWSHSPSTVRPRDVSICDHYTTLLLKNNTAANQKTLLTLVVNTAVIGNYTMPNVGVSVPGILTAGTYMGTPVNLLPYFSGGLASSNRGGMAGVSVNFLDDGGAAPLKLNMPANGTSSNQYMLLTHLYEYFGALLGCSMQNTTDYPAYQGQKSMYEVHKFMVLSAADMGYFITQVALSAQSFGVAADDITTVGNALTKFFDYKCSPATTIIPYQGAQLQSICTGANCPLDPMANCAAAVNVTAPTSATMSAGTTPTGTAAAGASGSATSTSRAGAAATGLSVAAAAAAGLAAFML